MSQPKDFSQQSSGHPADSTGVDAVRANTAKTANAESDATGLAKKLKAEGEAMANKHGG